VCMLPKHSCRPTQVVVHVRRRGVLRRPITTRTRQRHVYCTYDMLLAVHSWETFRITFRVTCRCVVPTEVGHGRMCQSVLQGFAEGIWSEAFQAPGDAERSSSYHSPWCIYTELVSQKSRCPRGRNRGLGRIRTAVSGLRSVAW
jgi:hypothetical protein